MVRGSLSVLRDRDLISVISSAIIEDIEKMRVAGLALLLFRF